MREYLKRSSINPKLAGGPSRIDGAGVLATAPIAEGEKLMEFGGLLISREEADGDLYRARSVWLARDGFYLALPKSDPEPSIDENLNHACDANSWLDGEVTLVARRAIAAAEEITLDQGTWNFDDDEYVWDQPRCSCGSSRCRGTLTNDDWQQPDVQERYRGHFHPFVQSMIDRGKVPIR